MREIDNWRQQLLILVIIFTGILGLFALFFGHSNRDAYSNLTIIGYVNERPLVRDIYDYHINNFQTDPKTPLTKEQEAQFRALLIDEELLIQQAMKDHLIATDPMLRQYIAQLATRKIYERNKNESISEEALKSFFETQKDTFTQSIYARVKRIYVRGAQGDSAQRVKDIRQALTNTPSGQSFDEIALSYGDDIPLAMPDRLMSFEELKEYLGPILAETAIKLPAGTITNAIRAGSGWHFLLVAERKKSDAPEYVEVREQVKTLYREQADDIFLNQKLQSLREDADIEFLE